MPRRLVVVLMSDIFDHFGEAFMSRMLKSKTGSRQQVVARLIIPVSLTNMERLLNSKPPKPPKSTTKLVAKVFKRNSKVKSVDGSPIQRYPSADGVARAYKLLSRVYAPGDEIILIGISGLKEDGLVIKDTIAELVNHLDSGTEPVIPSQPTSHTKENFCFETPANLLVGRSIAASSVTLIHRTGDNDVSGYSTNISKQFSLGVERLVSINWATGYESACHILRGGAGDVVAREITYFEDQGWHGNMIIFSTMSYIWYEPGATSYWANAVPVKKMSVPTSMLPASMRPENETIPSSATMEGSETEARRDSISSSYSGTSETYSSASGSSQSSVSLDSFWERSNDAKNPWSKPSGWQFTSLPASPKFPSAAFTASPPSSQASTPTSSAFTSRTSTLFTLNEPIPHDSPKPVAMSKHEVLTYTAFGNPRENWFLPARVIWKSL